MKSEKVSLKLIEKHRSFDGEQCKYSHYLEVLQCDMTFSIYLPSNKEWKEMKISTLQLNVDIFDYFILL